MPATLPPQTEPHSWLRFGSLVASFAHPDCPEHLLLNLPVLTPDQWQALATRPDPSPAVLDRVVELAGLTMLTTAANVAAALVEGISVVGAQPGLRSRHMVMLLGRLDYSTVRFRATSETSAADRALGLLLTHPNAQPWHPAAAIATGRRPYTLPQLNHQQDPHPASTAGDRGKGLNLYAELVRRRHPSVITLDVLGAREPHEQAVDLEHVLEADAAMAALCAGADLTAVTDCYVRLARDWTGPPEALLDTAAALVRT